MSAAAAALSRDRASEPISPPNSHGGAGEGWRAELELGFAQRGGRTIVAHRRHCGPMMVQSAFYPEGNPCHVYLLHPPGGLVGGDQLQVDVSLDAHTHALLTTPAAAKFYRSRLPGTAGPVAAATHNFTVRDGAALEWLPTESIVFDGANCAARSLIHLHAGSKLLAWEGWVFGRPACDERFASGSFAQHFEIHVEQRPVLIERNRMLAGAPWMQQPWGLGARPAMATLVAWPGTELALRAARAACVDGTLGSAACTEVDGLLVCRVMASSLPVLRQQMERWWQVLRPLVIGRDAVAPRIWAT